MIPSKPPLQDILPPQRRPVKAMRVPPPPPLEVRRRGRIPGGRLILGAIVAALILIIGLSIFFSGTTVAVEPRLEQATLDALPFSALRGDSSGALAFEVMTLTEEATKDVVPTGEENVELRAKGTIIIYNNYSSANQRLIKNTRFETKDGRIYRILNSIVVPGRTTKGGTTTPGSVEAEVVADQPGESYNSPLTDFTIPGFKGSPQFTTFYARSKTPMTGGFEGTQLVVSPSTQAEVREELQDKLRLTLEESARAQKPSGYLLFEGASTITFEEMPIVSEGEKARIREKATLQAIIFNESAFAALAATAAIGTYAGESLVLKNPEEVTVVLSQSSNPLESKVSGTISGRILLEYQFDEEALRADLLGKPRSALATVVKEGYSASITRATASMRPFWSRSFPDDGAKIKIVKTTPKSP